MVGNINLGEEQSSNASDLRIKMIILLVIDEIFDTGGHKL